MATRANFNKKKTDEDESLEARHGKKPNQKLKPYLVLQILMENTDENHIMSAADIVAALDEMGIYAERRSIYTDIEEINKALYMQDQGCTIQEAAEVLDDPEEGKEARFVAYQELGRKVIWALGLPGKTSPVTAGEIIAETIDNMLTERGDDNV